MTDIAKIINSAQVIIIKIGSSMLVDPVSLEIRTGWMAGLARDVAGLREKGAGVILTSSGSIALGRQLLKMGKKLALEEKQAAAAAGQVELTRLWAQAFAPHYLTTAQILLAPDDTETRRRHINARTTIQTLLRLGITPIVNENDTVTTYEIRFGDNDRLAARVAAMLSADLLILLSDIDGLYDRNPHLCAGARHIPSIPTINDEIMNMGGGAHAEFAVGGMATKLAAARIATGAGVDMLICKGDDQPIVKLLEGARFSHFHKQISTKTARQNWIAGAVAPKGMIVIDKGAEHALRAGKSLLPVGATHISGRFERGDLVQISNSQTQILGHGLAGYAAIEAQKICGQKSAKIETILGYEGRAELIHADDLVLTSEQKND